SGVPCCRRSSESRPPEAPQRRVQLSFRALNRRQTWAALSSHRATVFQAIRFTRAIADLFKPSTLSLATSSKVARRCWSRWYGVPVLEQNVLPQVLQRYRRRLLRLVL